VLFFGDDHGREAVVGRRDAYWASGGSAVTNSLLLSAVWVVGAVFADRNAPALGGILNQQGVGNSTVLSGRTLHPNMIPHNSSAAKKFSASNNPLFSLFIFIQLSCYRLMIKFCGTLLNIVRHRVIKR
jgi:hypothetical protein